MADKPLDAFEFLAKPDRQPVAAVVALFGDDGFLKRQVLLELRRLVLSGSDADMSLTTLGGKEAELRDVIDELATVALFGGGRRLVVVDDAGEFVTRNRPALEAYVAKPQRGGVLVLMVDTWPSNTKLYKALATSGLQIECKFPPPARLLKWLVSWSKQKHGIALEPSAAENLAEIVPQELGLLDQELAKLASLSGDGKVVTTAMVDEAVGSWRAKTIWDMLDDTLRGDAASALIELDRLLLGGEAPIALLGQLGASLRRFAAATRLMEQAEAAGRRLGARQALEHAGVKSFVLNKAEAQLRHLGRARGARLYAWLLETDLALKGASSAPARARLELEQLVVRLAAKAA